MSAMKDEAICRAEALLQARGLPDTEENFDAALADVMAGPSEVATAAESPELVEVLRMSAYALELAVDAGVVDRNAPRELKLALAEQAFLTIALDRILNHPDHTVSDGIVQGIGRLVYRDQATP